MLLLTKLIFYLIKADYIKDKDFFAFLENCDSIIEQAFNNKDNWQDWELIANQITGNYIKFRHEILECTNCGRLWMQNSKDNKYVSFLPESGKYEAILDK